MEINIRNDVSGDYAGDMALIGYCETPTAEQVKSLYGSSALARALTNGVAKDVFSTGFKVTGSGGSDKSDLLKGIDRLPYALTQAYGRARALNNSLFYIHFDSETDDNLKSKPKFKRNDTVMFTVIPDDYTVLSNGNVTYQKKTKNGKTKQRVEVNEVRCIQLIPQPNDRSMLHYSYNQVVRIESVAAASGLSFIQNNRADLVVNGSLPTGSDTETMQAAATGIKAVIKKIRESLSAGTKRLVMGGIGFDAKVITYPTNSPLNTLKALYQILSNYWDIPLRVMTGEGSGRLAGSEDYATYNASIDGIRNEYGALILEQVTAVLILSGYFKSGDKLEFNKQQPTTETEQADIDIKKESLVTSRVANGQAMGLSGQDLIDYVQSGEIKKVGEPVGDPIDG